LNDSIATSTNTEEDEDETDKKSDNGSMTLCANDSAEVVGAEMMDAARQGSGHCCSQQAMRMIRKAVVKATKGSVRAFVDTWLEQLGELKEGEAEACLSTPSVNGRKRSTNDFQPTNLEMAIMGTTTRQEAPLIAPLAVNLTCDNDDDEGDIDIVLSRIKEETILQNLLHKRWLNGERALTLEHQNG